MFYYCDLLQKNKLADNLMKRTNDFLLKRVLMALKRSKGIITVEVDRLRDEFIMNVR
jgi:hypothetical protein